MVTCSGGRTLRGRSQPTKSAQPGQRAHALRAVVHQHCRQVLVWVAGDALRGYDAHKLRGWVLERKLLQTQGEHCAGTQSVPHQQEVKLARQSPGRGLVLLISQRASGAPVLEQVDHHPAQFAGSGDLLHIFRAHDLLN